MFAKGCHEGVRRPGTESEWKCEFWNAKGTRGCAGYDEMQKEEAQKQRRCGWEYWTPRPMSQHSPGKKTKVITHRIERRIGAREVRRVTLELPSRPSEVSET
jgi:hypothetical protein